MGQILLDRAVPQKDTDWPKFHVWSNMNFISPGEVLVTQGFSFNKTHIPHIQINEQNNSLQASYCSKQLLNYVNCWEGIFFKQQRLNGKSRSQKIFQLQIVHNFSEGCTMQLIVISVKGLGNGYSLFTTSSVYFLNYYCHR